MDTVRDLGRAEPWQDSLERSRARRTAADRPAAGRPDIRRRKPTRHRILVRRGVAILSLALPIVILVSALAGGGTHEPATAAHVPALAPAAELRYIGAGGAGPLSRWPVSRAIEAGVTGACQPASAPGGYVNPLSGARVKSERIDQGVDYAGSGGLVAIGSATVTYVATAGTGWPGSFIEYRLQDGADAGCYVYYAEGVSPAAGLHVGQTVVAGQLIARIIPGWPTGIELGWGAGVSTATYAAETHQWSATSDQDSVPTAAGKSFSALIESAGGPGGKVEG